MLRVASAFVALVVEGLMLRYGHVWIAGPSSGGPLFHTLTNIAFWAAYFGGALFTADCLSGERREGTLGLLFLTDLKGIDVVLGKLVARSLVPFYCVIAVLPMLAVPLLIGGVTGGEFGRTAAVLLAALLLSASVGLSISVSFKSVGGTFTASLLVLSACSFGTALMMPLAPQFSWSFIALSLVRPSTALALSRDGAFQANETMFYASLGVMLLLASAFLGFSARRITDTWQTRPPQGVWLRLWNFWQRFVHGTSRQRQALRTSLLALHPLLWLHSRKRQMPRVVAGFVIVLGVVSLGFNLSEDYPWHEMRVAVLPLLFLHGSLLAMVACEAANFLPGIRQQGAMELILSTELSTREIIAGHLMTLRYLFRRPLVVVLVYTVLWLIIAEARAESNRAFAAAAALCFTANFLICLHAIAIVALHASAGPGRFNWPIIRSVFCVVVLPCVGYALLPPAPPVAALVIFTVVSAINARAFASYCQSRLSENLRERLDATSEAIPAR